MKIDTEVNPAFENIIFDWNYTYNLMVGGYGSGKSHAAATKICLKLLEEVRKALVVREVYETIRESCFDLIYMVLNEMDLLAHSRRDNKRVQWRTSPMQFLFPNGSKIIFKGMDKPVKLKSINDVSVVWMEEAPEIKYEGFKEILGRIRHPYLKIYYILTFNPVSKDSWCYTHFFIDEENGRRILDDEVLYKLKAVVKNDTYYHHSVPEDNMFLQQSYINTLKEYQYYDVDKYRVAYLGKFGVDGIKVLPQFTIKAHGSVMDYIREHRADMKFFTGMDFGFEESYNAVLKIAVDTKRKYLFIYWEYYKNHMTDDETADELLEIGLKDTEITADNAEPKAIAYYKKRGFKMRRTSKYAGSRLDNTRKVKRFRKIYCSDKCKNTIRELRDLIYYTDPRDKSKITYDKFNIDPHTFSAIWYALDRYDVADEKVRTYNTWQGYVGKNKAA